MAFVVGSVFYNLQNETNDIVRVFHPLLASARGSAKAIPPFSPQFLRGGAIFLSLLFPTVGTLSETTASFEGRAILAKHKGFSLYRPAALFFAQVSEVVPAIGRQ